MGVIVGPQVMDRASRFRKGIGSSPFESVNTAASPFASLGIQWCPRCRMEVDCDTQSFHRGTVFAYRRACGRCGRVIMGGTYNQVPLVGGTSPLMREAIEFVTEPGADRRGRRSR